jgi:hypothetical protein
MRKEDRLSIAEEKDFHVALSFASEDRAYVSRVAQILGDMGFRVFYDKHESVCGEKISMAT